MIVILKKDAGESKIEEIKNWLSSKDIRIYQSEGYSETILGLLGDTSKLDIDLIRSLEVVEDVKRIQEPYKKVNRKFHPEDTIIDISGRKIGGDHFAVIAGPCSVESKEQIITVAKGVKEAGAEMLRGGAFKPRTSPYAFQGMRAEGLELLALAKEETGLPIVTEIMDASDLPLFEKMGVDVIQVGARNMQNFELLKRLGTTKKVILLKRGFSATIEELLMSAEYIMASGNEKVILCERGIRTFETYTRNTLDLLAVSVLRQLTHLPVIVDPSHATGIAKYVEPMSLAAVAAGASGLIIEVHNDPSRALCDGAQSITPPDFKSLYKKVRKIRDIL